MKRYIEIWKKTNNLTGNEFDSEPLYGHNDKYLKTIQIFKAEKYQKKMHDTSACH